MKVKFLMAGLLGFISVTAFAQKGELSNAQSNFDKYIAFRSAQAALAMPSLKSAKESIDKAAVNDKTAALPQTFALKGAIYGAYVESDSTTAATNFPIAEAALKKAKELDTKGEYKKTIDDGYMSIARYQYNKGVAAYQAQRFDDAYKSFDFYRQVMPEDTNAVFNTGLSAYNSKNYTAAISNFSKLVTLKYSGGENVYNTMLSDAYLINKDTTGAIKVINEGLAKYPNSAALRNKEIILSLQTGRQKEVMDKLQTAITTDPKNKNLYYFGGLVYSQAADDAAKQIAKAKDAAAKTALEAKKTQNNDKAIEMYKKALEIDPNYFEANLNLGYVYSGPAIEAFNAANKIPGNKQKEYDAAMLKASKLADAAKPYLVKAVELEPKNADAISKLINYYKIKKDDANVAKYNKLLTSLK